MSVLFTDDFNRADSTSLGANWTEDSGNSIIESNTMRLPVPGSSAGLALTTVAAHAATADVAVQAKQVGSATADGGVVLRATGVQTYYACDSYGTVIEIYRHNNSSAGTLIRTATITRANGGVVRLEAQGTGANVTLKQFYNGVQAGADFVDGTANRLTVAGRTGLYNWLTSTATITELQYDDFSVEDFVSGTIDQKGYRFRNDDGSESTATWKAAQDTGATVPAGNAARLRALLNSVGDAIAGDYQLEYREVGAGSWNKVTN